MRWIMEKYSLVKLRNYVIHLIIGTALLLFGAGVLYAVLSEMIQIYDPASVYAYIFGIIACVLILLMGLFFLVKAFGFENLIFKKVSLEERAEFFQELEDEQTLFFDHYMFITRHFILLSIRSWNPSVKILRIRDLAACFGKAYYAGSDELVQYDVIFYDRKFQKYCCTVKGKKAGMMEEGWKAVCSLAPWIFHDDYEDFVSGLTKQSKKKSYAKVIEHRRAAAQVSEDTVQDAVINAADAIRAYSEKKNPRTGSGKDRHGEKAVTHTQRGTDRQTMDDTQKLPEVSKKTQKLPGVSDKTQKLPRTKKRR